MSPEGVGGQVPREAIDAVRTAEIVLPCDDLDHALAFYAALGFRVELIFPADNPAVATVSGHGVRLRLERVRGQAPGKAHVGVFEGSWVTLRLRVTDPSVFPGRRLVAPDGTRIEIEEADSPLALPPLEPALVFGKKDEPRKLGRAGMRYRDLIPGRQGGRFIASLISVDGGPVADYVHYHKLRFQMIYCRRGWVRLVYEDQGPPFLLRSGDCVLQPPGIRHRVLESSPGLEVIELACPALHETHADLEMALPAPALRPERLFGGQRFVRHIAESAAWQPWHARGFECRDTGIAAATSRLADVRVVRPKGTVEPVASAHDLDLLFFFVLEGAVTLEIEGRDRERLEAGESAVIPAGIRYALAEPAHGLELLEVALADYPFPTEAGSTRQQT